MRTCELARDPDRRQMGLVHNIPNAFVFIEVRGGSMARKPGSTGLSLLRVSLGIFVCPLRGVVCWGSTRQNAQHRAD